MKVDVKSNSLAPKTFYFQIGHYAGISDYKEFPRGGVRAEWKENWRVFPASLTQPAASKQTNQVICPACGTTIPFTVRGPIEAKRERTKYLIGGSILLAAGIALFFSGWFRFPGAVRFATMQDFLRCVPVILGFLGVSLVGHGLLNEFDMAISMEGDGPYFGDQPPRHKLFRPSERV